MKLLKCSGTLIKERITQSFNDLAKSFGTFHQ
jgi:hypothetical protein